MKPAHLAEAFEYDSDASIEDILVEHEPYIVASVSQRASRSSNVSRSGTCFLDLDDYTQQVRIKLWGALSRRRVEHKKAYIRAIVQNVFNDIPRAPKQPLPLLMDDDGELFMGGLVNIGGGEAVNPEDALIEYESFFELLDFLISCIAEMPPRQRRVLACSVYESSGERLDVIETFRRYAITSDVYLWPRDEEDKKLLQASRSAALRNLHAEIRSRLSGEYKQMKIPEKIEALLLILTP